MDITQLLVRADAGGEGSVILNSVQGLLQGLFPPTPDNNITLANGMTVVSPLGGYQYIPGMYSGHSVGRGSHRIDSRKRGTQPGHLVGRIHFVPREYKLG